MHFPPISEAAWRAQVEKELAGTPFDKALVATTPEGLAVQPLYTAAPPLHVPGMPSSFTLHREGELIGESIGAVTLHEAGADAADELAVVLAHAVADLKRGVRRDRVELAVGRDTFAELCKLRALRIVWSKLMTAAGHPGAKLVIHARCSRRTLTQRDPWVNMLRATTQVFAAILGGADEITPSAFDDELSAQSALGARVALNTGLILQHESSLGRVVDPSAGSYYLDTFTDQLAREGWKRFQALEQRGGLERALPQLMVDIEARWTRRLQQLATRRVPVLGVSEFANVAEQLPAAPRAFEGPGHRDAEAFERLRLIADRARPEALLVTLGSFAESRPRAGFSANFFGAGGFTTRESALAPGLNGTLACLCGTDERYATDAAAAARQLKAAGFKTVLVAGKPGASEAALREAGVDGFIFVGCDVVATLSSLLEGTP